MLIIENDAHDIEKHLLKTQVSEKFLHSEVNLIIQYIIVHDQDGQNNNILYFPFPLSFLMKLHLKSIFHESFRNNSYLLLLLFLPWIT